MKNIDFKWINDNESNELKNDKEIQNVKKMRENATLLMREIAEYISYDLDDIIIPDESEEMSEIDKYADIYRKCSKLDLTNKEELSLAYIGYEMINRDCPKLLEDIKNQLVGYKK